MALIWNLLQFAMYVKNTYVGFVANVSKLMTLFTDITIVLHLAWLQWCRNKLQAREDEKIRWSCIPSYRVVPKGKASIRYPSL